MNSPDRDLADAESANAGALPAGGIAIVIGAAGGIGSALVSRLSAQRRFSGVLGLGRGSSPPLDLTDEASIVAAARHVAALRADLRLMIDASGILHGDGLSPEKTWRELDAAQMGRAFAVNAIGPALLMKHFLPLLPRQGRSVFATLSARVGSIGDNRLGGWYSYRASKAALNQIVRTSAIELARTHRHAVCVALHPGTVETPLSRPFAKTGLQPLNPATAARDLLAGLARLGPAESGGFFDRHGAPLPF